MVSTDLTQFPLKSIKTLPDITEEQQAELLGAKTQDNTETINLKTRKEVPDVSPRRNVKHAQEQRRAFVKEAAICPVEAKEMLSPPSSAQDGHTEPSDRPSWKGPFSRGCCTHPSSHSALLEVAQLTLMGMQTYFPC